MMQEFDNIKDMVYCEIEEISHQPKLDMNTVKVLGELVDILKDIGSVEMFEEGVNIQEDDYSLANSYGRGGYSRMPVYYNNGSNSYRSGRSYNSGYSRRSRNNGYSRDDAKDHMIHKLEGLMEEAVDERDRQAIKELIEKMDK